MPELFISYSRSNKDFVQKLYTALETQGRDAWIDWDDIPLTADWWSQICRGIEASDSFVFVISPESMSSLVCNMEVAHAIRFNKRLIPLLYQNFDEKQVSETLQKAELSEYFAILLENRDLMQMARQNWQMISQINWIIFDKPENFDASLSNLITALDTDLKHAEQHTLYLLRAITWNNRERQAGYLLTAQEVTEAKKWLETNVDKQPYFTDLHRDYIATSAKALRRQRLRSNGALFSVGSAVLMISVIVVWIFGEGFFAPVTEMSGIFNIAVAEFAELRDGKLVEGQDGLFLSNNVYDALVNSFEEAGLSDVLETRHEGIDFIAGDTPAQRAASAARLAQRLHADVVIYGVIDTTTVPARFQPEFFVSPRLTGADELMGESAFGEALNVRLPVADNPGNRTLLLEEVLPRFEALTHFMFGLAFMKVNSIDLALDQFQQAESIRGWSDDDGKEVLYLWIGTAYNERPFEEYACPFLNNTVDFGVFCAEEAYNYALVLNPAFARAHIGLGNVWLQQAKPPILEDFVDCTAYDFAADAYEVALTTRTGDEPGHELLAIKAYGNLGWAYGEAFRSNCGGEYLARAHTAFNSALAAYAQIESRQLADQEAARIHYLQGLVHVSADKFDAALASFHAAIDVAEPDRDAEVWQDLRFNAFLQIGKIYLETANSADEVRYKAALDALETIIKAYEAQRYSNQIVTGDAYYQAGLAKEGLGDEAAAQRYFQRVLELPDADEATQVQAQAKLG